LLQELIEWNNQSVQGCNLWLDAKFCEHFMALENALDVHRVAAFQLAF
jgi:hypothetical protein